eukprot:s1139_g15.t1
MNLHHHCVSPSEDLFEQSHPVCQPSAVVTNSKGMRLLSKFLACKCRSPMQGMWSKVIMHAAADWHVDRFRRAQALLSGAAVRFIWS